LAHRRSKNKLVISQKSLYILKSTAVFAVLVLLLYYLKDNYNSLRIYNFEINKLFLISSFVVLLIAILLIPVIWYFLTRLLSCNLSFKESLTSRLISEIGKYLPGRVFGYGYLIMHYKNAGIKQKRVLNCSVYELLLSTISAFIFFTITLFFNHYQKLSEFKLFFILISIISIIALHPYFLQRILNYGLTFFKKEIIKSKISYSKVIALLFLYVFTWALFGVAFFLFTNAFTTVPLDKIVYISGVFAVSTFAGFLAFFLPAGIGAREGMLIFLLTGILGTIPTLIISIGSRAWMILADLLLFLIALIITKFRKTKELLHVEQSNKFHSRNF